MTIPNHDRLFFEQLESDNIQQAYDEAMYDHEWDLNYKEYLDHYNWSDVHPAIEAKYTEHFERHLGEKSLLTFEAWLDDIHASEIIEWIQDYNNKNKGDK